LDGLLRIHRTGRMEPALSAEQTRQGDSVKADHAEEEQPQRRAGSPRRTTKPSHDDSIPIRRNSSRTSVSTSCVFAPRMVSPATSEDDPSGTGSHASAEAVSLLAAASMGLKGLLHRGSVSRSKGNPQYTDDRFGHRSCRPAGRWTAVSKTERQNTRATLCRFRARCYYPARFPRGTGATRFPSRRDWSFPT